jgi:hypothetical protein
VNEHSPSPEESASPRHPGQAWHVLRGFRYQLLQALNTWLRLQAGEALWLETEEDFAVESKSLFTAAQVKSSAAARGPTSNSLRSESVRGALARHWERSRQGAEVGTQLVFIANGDVAHERDFTFPNGRAGLDYWAKAAIDADTAPIRTALALIFEAEPLGAWLSTNPTDEELRARLLRRVRWEMRALEYDALSELIHDTIADLFLDKGFLVNLADEALHGLFDRVYETACERSVAVRRLTRRDLHRSIEDIASPTAALQAAARSFVRASIADDTVFLSSVQSGGATRVIITSHSIPTAARLAQLGGSPRAAVQSPYFSEEEVRAMIDLRDAPPPQTVGAWSQLLLASTYGGHPLLVSAKISNLRSRNWPASALAEDIGPNTSDAVRATREEARRRLVTEIPSPEARRLLRRLGCVFERADDALLIKLAHADPPISNATDALAILRGSWIESLPDGEMRLSPLIADIGHDVPTEEIMACRSTAADHWLGDGTLNQRTLPLCFWNAFLGRVPGVLVHICQAIVQLPREHIRGAAALLSPMTMLTTENSIYPEAPAVATMLRLLQFEVCNAIEDDEAAGRAAARLIVEIDAIQHAELKALQTSIAAQRNCSLRTSLLTPRSS